MRSERGGFVFSDNPTAIVPKVAVRSTSDDAPRLSKDALRRSTTCHDVPKRSSIYCDVLRRTAMHYEVLRRTYGKGPVP